jgi:hypothetical protein
MSKCDDQSRAGDEAHQEQAQQEPPTKRRHAQPAKPGAEDTHCKRYRQECSYAKLDRSHCVRLPSVRLPSVRLPSTRLPSARLPSARLRCARLRCARVSRPRTQLDRRAPRTTVNRRFGPTFGWRFRRGRETCAEHARNPAPIATIVLIVHRQRLNSSSAHLSDSGLVSDFGFRILPRRNVGVALCAMPTLPTVSVAARPPGHRCGVFRTPQTAR